MLFLSIKTKKIKTLKSSGKSDANWSGKKKLTSANTATIFGRY